MNEASRKGRRRTTKRAPLRAQEDRLASHERSSGIAHRTPDDEAALDDNLGLDAEEGRPPNHHVGHLAVFERADVAGNAERACSIDGILGDETADPGIVAEAWPLFRQRAALVFHLRRQLPGAADDFVDAAHALAVRPEHRDCTDVVQYVLRRNGLR